MELKDQVCSLELAKKLKELGEKQKCLWYWQYNGESHILPEYTLECGRGYGISKKDCYAPTVAELGKRLPMGCKTYKDLGGWYYEVEGEMKPFRFNTEANARAKMLIYLLENKLIEEG